MDLLSITLKAFKSLQNSLNILYNKIKNWRKPNTADFSKNEFRKWIYSNTTVSVENYQSRDPLAVEIKKDIDELKKSFMFYIQCIISFNNTLNIILTKSPNIAKMNDSRNNKETNESSNENRENNENEKNEENKSKPKHLQDKPENKSNINDFYEFLSSEGMNLFHKDYISLSKLRRFCDLAINTSFKNQASISLNYINTLKNTFHTNEDAEPYITGTIDEFNNFFYPKENINSLNESDKVSLNSQIKQIPAYLKLIINSIIIILQKISYKNEGLKSIIDSQIDIAQKNTDLLNQRQYQSQ